MTDNDKKARELVIAFLDAQKALYDFINVHPDMCVYVDPKAELNFTHIGMCGHHEETDYYRIADVTLFGESFQICSCRICHDKISFIPFPNGWHSSPYWAGVPAQLTSQDVVKYINNINPDIDDINLLPGIARDVNQHASILQYELIEKKTPSTPISIAEAKGCTCQKGVCVPENKSKIDRE